MRIDYGHLTFCTNIYVGESWDTHFAVLKESFPLIKKDLSPHESMGIGLRLSNQASIEILEDDHLLEFKQWLQAVGGYVFTMNGFPYGGFHHTRVKDQVHAPDWTTDERVGYTTRLFNILAQLLPEGMDGGISTSPLSYKPWFTTAEESEDAKNIATKNILSVVEALHHIHESTGTLLHLDIEPEPDGFLESGPEFINWFENDLLAKGKSYCSEKLHITEDEAEKILKRHVCLCYDVCHFAIGYEPHTAIIEQLRAKGIKIGKIQISAALKALLPTSPVERLKVTDELSKFDEPTYLHQVIAKRTDSSLIRYPDLSEALADSHNPDVTEWRAHFHVPIFEEDLGLVKSTQTDITEVLSLQKSNPFTNHLEVETYTWGVLPSSLKIPLNESIIRELAWVNTKMSS
ncbi:hypothetical protein SAMN05421821_101204 [Mucilaginibacter lappiensis]|uniref:Xylose isomerase-like TIM barrel n=1 Tax=Mucilaginibacter lappiensis TaxID=354630 RepID=A0ABR6PDR5_9SPHI|nr:metabolite traffic protein EboE [Mucilaginibacter lappiensis]MBB6107883.1 hypothetical protein [Mucilaginibacter lappiensis]SIP93853.1 hypothetical protein SAMN05421821_101204 [Mucilaginibacter lappiensis]